MFSTIATLASSSTGIHSQPCLYSFREDSIRYTGFVYLCLPGTCPPLYVPCPSSVSLTSLSRLTDHRFTRLFVCNGAQRIGWSQIKRYSGQIISGTQVSSSGVSVNCYCHRTVQYRIAQLFVLDCPQLLDSTLVFLYSRV